MGMFDYIRIEQILPGETEISKVEYQTKSFECLMEEYVITAKGELYLEKWDYEWVDDEGYLFFGGYLNKIPNSYRRTYLCNFYGDVRFYGKAPHHSTGKWREYYARFTEGSLKRMWYVDLNY